MTNDTAKTESKTAGVLAAVFAVSLWAAWIPVTRLGVTSSLVPVDVAALRFFTSGLLLLPFFLRDVRTIPWQRPIALFWLVMGAGVPYLLFFGHGLKIANSSQGAILGPGAMSLIVSIMAATLLKETIPVQRKIGIAIGLLGIVIILAADILHGGVRIFGYLLILTAGSCWAAHTVATRTLALTPLTTTSVVSVLNGLMILPYYIFDGGFSRLAAAPRQDVLLQVIFQGIIVAIVALLAYAFAVRRLGASATAVFPPLTPVFAAILGYYILGDTLDLSTIIGLITVFIGVLLAARAS
jgi:drug/metabolite transporter (DMT)-like permease